MTQQQQQEEESNNNLSLLWWDKTHVQLNACSLETLYRRPPILNIHEKHHNITSYPLVIGCYQLQEERQQQQQNQPEEDSNVDHHDESHNVQTQKEDEECSQPTKSRTHGEILLYGIGKDRSFHSAKAKNHQVIQTDSGVLDGKWLASDLCPFLSSSSSSSLSLSSLSLAGCNVKPNGIEDNVRQQYPLYATANASGSIHIYRLEESDDETKHDSEHEDEDDNDNDNHCFQLKHITCSSSDGKSNQDGDHGLALSLAWDESMHGGCSSQERRIISSYSKGSLALHTLTIHSTLDSNHPSDTTATGTGTGSGSLVMVESQRWNAHSLFGRPSEVWTTCFASNRHYSTYSNTVISGGDDCKMKLWDLRCTCCGYSNQRPIHVQDDFEAGVTAVSYHPTLEHVFAVGSYNEEITLWDMRKLGKTMTTAAAALGSVAVGGGVWRMKWHPWDATRMLVGAMHGGCRIVQVEALGNPQELEQGYEDGRLDMQVVQEFKQHKSMAYGADWILGDDLEAAASCSFYDKTAYIWNTQPS